MHSYAQLASNSGKHMKQSEKASLLDHVATGCETQPTNLHVSYAYITLLRQ